MNKKLTDEQIAELMLPGVGIAAGDKLNEDKQKNFIDLCTIAKDVCKVNANLRVHTDEASPESPNASVGLSLPSPAFFVGSDYMQLFEKMHGISDAVSYAADDGVVEVIFYVLGVYEKE